MEARFDGPFASWINATTFGVKGDGVADDTAALQSAINSVVTSHGVLWLPRGTYRISQTLKVLNLQKGLIVGEDPASTTIMWDGSDSTQAQALLDCESCVNYTISRLTLDGAGRLPSLILLGSSGNSYSTEGSLHDLHLKGAAKGIQIAYAAEITSKRIHFDGLTQAGISVENWDAINVNVMDSLFNDCLNGVTNLFAEGAFNVSNNVFLRSASRDLSQGNAGVFTARNNVSIGSNLFFVSGAVEASSQISLQNNEVTSTSNPLEISNPGTISLIDNIFHVPAGVPVLIAKGNYPIDILSIGNAFVDPQPYRGQIGRITSYLEASGSVVDSPFQAPIDIIVPPQSGRTVYEVSSLDANAIQQALNLAVHNGSGVVHIPRGTFSVDQTLTVTGSSDVSIVGDSYTDLQGSSSLRGPVLKITGSRVELSDFSVDNLNNGEAIRIELPDAPGDSVLCDECHTSYPTYGFNPEYLDNASVEARSSLFNAGIYGVMVHGGLLHQNSLPGLAKSSTLMSSVGTYLVDMGGHLLVSDGFHDLHQGDYQFFVNGKGFLTEQGYATYTASNHAMTLQAAQGDVTILGTQMDSVMNADSLSSARILLAGSMQIAGKDPISLPQSAVTAMHLGDETNVYNGLSTRWPNDNVSASALERALSDSSTVFDAPKRLFKGGASRIRINKVASDFSAVAFHIVPSATSSNYQQLSLVSAASGRSLSECMMGSENPQGWSLVDGHDGSFGISGVGGFLGEEDAVLRSGGRGLAAVGQLNSSDQRWLFMPYGDGSFKIVNRASGLLLDTDGSSCFTSVEKADDPRQTWIVGSALVTHP